MQILRMGLIAAGVTLLAANAAMASEQEVLRDGKAEFQSYCVACHGEDAKGDGRMTKRRLAFVACRVMSVWMFFPLEEQKMV